jgi:hypothetical protein
MFYLELKPEKVFSHPQNSVKISPDILEANPVLIIDNPVFPRSGNDTVSCQLDLKIYYNLDSVQNAQPMFKQSVTATPEEVEIFGNIPVPSEYENLLEHQKTEWRIYQFLLSIPEVIFIQETIIDDNGDEIIIEKQIPMTDENGDVILKFRDWELNKL